MKRPSWQFWIFIGAILGAPAGAVTLFGFATGLFSIPQTYDCIVHKGSCSGAPSFSPTSGAAARAPATPDGHSQGYVAPGLDGLPRVHEKLMPEALADPQSPSASDRPAPEPTAPQSTRASTSLVSRARPVWEVRLAPAGSYEQAISRANDALEVAPTDHTLTPKIKSPEETGSSYQVSIVGFDSAESAKVFCNTWKGLNNSCQWNDAAVVLHELP